MLLVDDVPRLAASKRREASAPEIERWFTSVESSATARTERTDGTERGLLAVVAPLVDRAHRMWREATLRTFAGTSLLRVDIDSLQASLARALDVNLHAVVRPTLALELQVAGLRGLLPDAPPDARFAAFVAQIAEPSAALALLREYPVLVRQVTIVLDAWRSASCELLERLVADVPLLIDARFVSSGRTLVGVDVGRGDTHRGGRSVAVLTWDDGSKVVYKPRSLAVDAHFGELVAWVNGHRIAPELRAPRVFDRGTYGFMEFVAARPCANADEVRKFFARQGALLALVHVLDGVDLHAENVIACGEHPMLIDLEALFHPRAHPRAARGQESAMSEGAAAASMEASVLRVGLLPQPSLDGSYDFSGLGGGGGLWKVPLPVWKGHGTDQLRRHREWVSVPETLHQPTLDGRPVSALEHRQSLCDAFDACMRLVARERDALLSPGGEIERFAHDEVRAILRPTEVYALLLRETYHPDLLRDARDRERAFDRLSLAIQEQPELARVIDAEREDLWQGDVPYFTAFASSRDLLTSRGEVVEDFFAESAMRSVARKLRALDDDERARQTWFVQSALTALGSKGDAERLRAKIYAPSPAETADEDSVFIETACGLGDRVAALALHRGRAVEWIGLAFRKGRWEVTPSGSSLAEGSLGIALFLAMLGRAAGEPSYTRLAEVAFASALREDTASARARSIGAFEGAGGALFVAAHLRALWGGSVATAPLESALDAMEAAIADDDDLDVIGGAAGAIRSLLAVAIADGNGRAADLAVACGDHLLARSEVVGDGVGWRLPASNASPLAGYAHGASGIASSLLALADYSGEARFAAVAQRAFAYERSLYCKTTRNWSDERVDASPGAVGSVAWCHGAAGIGLARVQALRASDDARLVADLNAAVETTRARGFGASHCLCHGDLGNLELLFADAERRKDPAAKGHARRLATTIAASVRAKPLCGNPHRIETPGLLSGIAGIGYGLLRVADPRGVPSILTLDPPRERR
jgi:type 2 lantibiotic biosynthesis protein LanM